MEYFLSYPYSESRFLSLFSSRDRHRAVVLPGYSATLDSSGYFVGLIPDEKAVADGILISPGPSAAETLGKVMAAFGLVPHLVHPSGERATVTAFICESPANSVGRYNRPDTAGATETLLFEVFSEVISNIELRTDVPVSRYLHGIGFRALARSRGNMADRPARFRTTSTADDVESISRPPAYTNYFAVEEHSLRHRRFDGNMSGVVDRAVLASGDGVTVLPFDPVTQNVLLIEQFRAGPYARHDPAPWMLETIAGRCDRPEHAEITARREATEEAGISLGQLEKIAGYYTSPGVSSEFITAFVGEADLSEAGGVFGLPEEDEDIRSIVLPAAEAFQAVRSGEINNAPLMLSLMWLENHVERLARKWNTRASA